jgi:hypothetical protein
VLGWRSRAGHFEGNTKGRTRNVKRLIACAAAVALMALPVTAVAGTHTSTKAYSGTVAGGGTLRFKATVTTKKRRHHHKKVFVSSVLPAPTSKGFSGVPITCDQESVTVASTWLIPLKVKGNAFSKNLTSNGGTVHQKFTGQFTHKTRKAAGTFRAHGDFDAGHTNCDTGTVHWKASR